MTCEKGTRTSSNPMSIHRLEAVIYESHWVWHTHSLDKPDWGAIEKTILQMDKFYRPIAILFLENSDALWLTGDKAAWHIQKYESHGDTYSEAVRPEGDDTEVQVWTSDQGFTTTWRHAFSDSGTVLEVVKYLYDTGQFTTFLNWE
jgi:hypothetical protein